MALIRVLWLRSRHSNHTAKSPFTIAFNDRREITEHKPSVSIFSTTSFARKEKKNRLTNILNFLSVTAIILFIYLFCKQRMWLYHLFCIIFLESFYVRICVFWKGQKLKRIGTRETNKKTREDNMYLHIARDLLKKERRFDFFLTS